MQKNGTIRSVFLHKYLQIDNICKGACSGMDKYILPVRADVIREIGKRGVKELKKDETGIVKKRINKNGSSSFGWGTVDDTIPVNKKELKDAKRQLDATIAQITKGMSPLECANDPSGLIYTPNGKRPPPINVDDLPDQPQEPKKIRIPEMIEEWHTNCKEHYDRGMIGFVPECYQAGGMPPIDEIVHTTVGQVLLNFSTFIKRVF